MSATLIFHCDCVSWRLELFSAALERFWSAARALAPDARVQAGYRTLDDLVLLTVRVPAVQARAAAKLDEEARLPGLRLLDVRGLVESEHALAARLLDGCDLVMRLGSAGEVVATLRGRLGMLQDPRAAIRLKVGVPLRLEAGGRQVDAWTADLTSGGVYVRTGLAAPAGARMRVRFFPDDGAERLDGEVEVVRQGPDGFGARLFLAPETLGGLYQRIRALRLPRHAPAARPREEPPAPRRLLLAARPGARRDALAAALREGGCEVAETADAAAATAALLDSVLALDLLVVDAALPADGARELLHRVRRLGGETELPIALLGQPLDPQARRLAAESSARPVEWNRPLGEVAAELHVLASGPART